MTWIEVIALGALQGLTEFLPVSSSGHLSLLEHHFEVREPQTLFDLCLHLGTLVAVLWFFRGVVGDVVAGSVGWASARLRGRPAATRQSEAARVAGLVVLASLPTGAVGAVLGSEMEAWSSRPPVTGALLIVNGFVLLSTLLPSRAATSLAEFPAWKALLVGAAQGFAILRGVSRSGSTIVAASHLGMGGQDAARFSFLLFLPAVIGGVVLEAGRGWPEAAIVDLGRAVVGGVCAFGVGVVALRLLLRVLAAGRLYWFGPYCIAVGCAVLWGAA